MKGVYQHCGKTHLHLYMAEFDFRYSNRAALGSDDVIRADTALLAVAGKRLTYQTPNQKNRPYLTDSVDGISRVPYV